MIAEKLATRPVVRRILAAVLAIVVAIGATALLLALAYPLPDRAQAMNDAPVMPGPGELSLNVQKRLVSAEAPTGIRMLPVALDSFAARLATVRAASRTIDAQYYIWNGDLSGRMLLAELIAAADRGVRVRLLIDDNPTAGLDAMWAAANSHPNISVRIFNPLTIRSVRAANYLFAFPRLNRRMHNKSLTIDGAVTIVGGRNVGDEYFGATDDGLFIDLDALMIGAVVPRASEEFERYWKSESAYPAQLLLDPPDRALLDDLRRPKFGDSKRAEAYRDAAANAINLLDLAAGHDRWIWANVTLYADDPAKALGKARHSDLLATQVQPIVAAARKRFDLVSGYFVPGENGGQLLTGLARRAVATRVVTNSIQVTDVPLVNAGYAPSRERLLASGVALYEARPVAGQGKRESQLGSTSFSGGGESVHAKTFAIDDRLVFVGSFNFDPRSAELNCEMGVIIDSPRLALAFGKVLDNRLVDGAYRLSLDPNGRVLWHSRVGNRTVTQDVEPGTTAMQRAMITVISWLPVQWLL